VTYSLSKKCIDVRKDILKAAVASKEGHIGSSYAIVELLVALFDSNRLNLNQFIRCLTLSKGHAVFALYAAMKNYGLMSDSDFSSIGQEGSMLIGHVPQIPNLGLLYGTGSLGHGFPFAVGQAIADHLGNSSKRRYVIIGDGEMNEGSIWETLNIIHKFKPLNIDIIIDYNSSTERAIPSTSFIPTLSVFENFTEINGHDILSLKKFFEDGQKSTGIRVLWANTLKGHPISEMTNNPRWHHRVPTETELKEFLDELDDK